MKKISLILLVIFGLIITGDAQNVGLNITNPTGKFHIKHNSTGSSPQLRLTEDDNSFARIKMENTTHLNAFWDIAGKADANANEARLNFFFGNPTGGDKMTIMGNGNVGIGTSSPLTELHIKDGDGWSYATIESQAGGDAVIQLTDNTALGVNNDWTIRRDGSDFGKLQWRNNNDVKMQMDNLGNLGISGSLDVPVEGYIGKIYVTSFGGIESTMNLTPDFLKDYFYLRYNNSNERFDIGLVSGLEVPRLSILDNGKVGIGTTTPSETLDVAGNTKINGVLSIDRPGDGEIINAEGLEVLSIDKLNGLLSWGTGGNYNFFTDNIKIGGTTSFFPASNLHIVDPSEPSLILETGISGGGTTTYWKILRNNVGAMQWFHSTFHKMTLESTGDLGLGIEDPNVRLDVSGSIEYTGSLTDVSDLRLKKNIEELPSVVDQLNLIRPVTYEMRREEFPNMNFEEGRELGVIAQELEPLFPDLVKTGPDGYKSVDYTKLTVVLLKATQEQQQMIEDQKNVIENLIKEVNKLKQEDISN